MFRASVFLCFLTMAAQARSPAAFFKETWEERLRDEPELASRPGRHEFDGQWNDHSKAGCDAKRAHMESRLAMATKLSGAQVSLRTSPQDKLTLRLPAYDLRVWLASRDAEVHLLPVGPLFGLHTNVYQAFDGRTRRTFFRRRLTGMFHGRVRRFPTSRVS